MTTTAETLFQAALQLDERERGDLAAKLIDSIDPTTDENWTEAWDAEIAKRVDELDQGNVKTIPWEVVRRRIVEVKP